MSGWEQCIGTWVAPKGVIGIVVAAKFPDEEIIREKLAEGVSRVSPDTVWVLRGPRKRGDAISVAWDVLEELGIEPLLAPSNTQYFGTHATSWRDGELRNTCERVIVFHDISSNITKSFLEARGHARVFVIERGKAKSKPKRKRHAPVGAEDRAIAARNRDEGIAHVATTAPTEWKRAFAVKAYEFAATRQEFTYEDILSVCPPPQGVKAQACAFVMTRLRKEGVIVWTGRVVPATRVSRNVGDMKVWVGA